MVLTEADALDVYAVVLRDAYGLPDSEPVVLNPELSTSIGEFGDPPHRVPRDAWEAYASAHGKGATALPRELAIARRVEWLTRDELAALEGGDEGHSGPWPAFRSRFGNRASWITFTPIGFSRDGRSALVQGTIARDVLSGSSDYFVLRRSGGRWRVVETLNIAIA